MNFKFYFLPFCFILAFESDLFSQFVDRGPYLQLSTPNSKIVKWRTNAATDSKLWYGNDPFNLNLTITSAVNTTDHEIEISGLTPNTTYYYAVGNAAGQMTSPDYEHYFMTAPTTGSTPLIRGWVLGDAGSKNDNQRAVRDAYYNYIGNEHTDLILALGDNAYSDGTQAEYDSAWFTNMYEDILIQSPLWSTFGNHDAHSASSATQTGPYYEIFTFPKNAEAGGVPSGTEAYYSFDYGNIHFVVLNSEDVDREPGSPMLQWLQNDVDANNQDWLVAIFHHPAYSGRNNNNTDTNGSERDMRENTLPILEAAGVDFVLFGHSHNYQRSFLIKDHYDVSDTFDPDLMGVNMGDGRLDGDCAYYKAIGGPQDGEGTVYMVTGSAGQIGSSDLNHPVMYLSGNILGSVAFEVNDLQMDVSFITDEEVIKDYFSIIKQIEPPVAEITSPANQSYYENPETITIEADASDSNGSIAEVEFFVNNVSIGIDNSAPYSMNWTIPSNGFFRVKVVAKDNNDNVNTDVITVQVGQLSVCSAVSSGDADAEERGGGNVSTGSSDLELVFDGGANQEVGLRFQNLDIPQGATILSAYIQFTVDETTNSNPCNLNIYGEASPEPTSFTTGQNNITNRVKTSSFVPWSPPNWLSVGDSGPAQQTVDISPVIQEIVDQGQFEENSAMVIIINGTGERVAESFNGDPSSTPVLCIEYLPVCTDDDNDGTCNANDLCPEGPEPGTPCNDNDPGTYNDLIGVDCICAGTPYDCPLLMADIGDACTDNDPGTYGDMIDANCNCNGIPYDCPLLMVNIGDLCDDGDPDTYFDAIDENCICMGSPLGNGTTVSAQVNTSSDDAEERGNGSVKTNSSDLELVFDNSNQTVGMRFNGMEIPQGAIILDAYVQFTVDESFNSNPCNLTIYGEDADDAQTFNNSNFNITQRPFTTASAFWSPQDWNIVGESGLAQQTVDISEVIQEITDRNGYSSNSSIVILIQGTGERVAESYDGDDRKAPELFVTYDFDCPDADNDTVCDDDDVCPNGPEPGTPCDDGDPDTYNDMIDVNCICSGTPTGTDITVCSRVTSGNDDAEERPSGSVKTTSSDLELILDGANDQTVGMRFVDLEIPQGAVISSASIQFTADESNNTNPCALNIFGEDSDDASEFASSNNNITNRPQTTAQVSWNPSEWLSAGDSGPAQKTTDISQVIQEIVNRPGYTSNSAIVIMIDGIGKRVAESYNGDAPNAPELCIEYSVVLTEAENQFELSEAVGNQKEIILKEAESKFTDEDNLLKIYPNPTRGEFSLIFNNEEEEAIALQIKDLHGRTVYLDKREVYQGQNKLQVENLNLSNGIYFVTLNFNQNIKTAKFIIFK